MTHGSLFSGIGGFDLAASRMGWDNVFQVEIDPFCRRVLQKNFPDAQRFTDIKNFDGSEFAGKIDIISGGFPCQPFSVAGQRKGKTDDRALWGEMLRVIRTIRPAWVVGENVAGIISMELDTVLADLEGIGYTCQALVVPACAVNALHRRDRVWIVAHANQQSAGVLAPNGTGRQKRRAPVALQSEAFRCGNGAACPEGFGANCVGSFANSDRLRQQQPERIVAEVGRRLEYGDSGATSNPNPENNGENIRQFSACIARGSKSIDSDPAIWGRQNGRHGAQPEAWQADEFGNALGQRFQSLEWQPYDTSDLLRTAYGVPGRVDRRGARIKSLGNAIVPQVAFNIYHAISLCG